MARAVTKWTRACEDLFEDSDFSGDFEDSKSISGGIFMHTDPGKMITCPFFSEGVFTE